MLDWVIAGLAIIGGIVSFCYILSRVFVSEKTCKARQDCLEAKIAGLQQCVEAKFKFVNSELKEIKMLIGKLFDK